MTIFVMMIDIIICILTMLNLSQILKMPIKKKKESRILVVIKTWLFDG